MSGDEEILAGAGRRKLPPMPSQVAVHGTVRGTADRETVVARCLFVDAVGEEREIDLAPSQALQMMVELAEFLGQIGCWP